jgi:hypothetical protein
VTDWIVVYNNYKILQGSVIKAREIVVGLIMNDYKHFDEQQAKDFLENIIRENVEEEIAAQNQKIMEIRRRAG